VSPDPLPPGRPGERPYPRTWLLVEGLGGEEPRLLGREVVDLSPGAIELRRAARDLRRWADERERWLPADARGRWSRLGAGHRRELSFGPEIAYCVEHDSSGRIHGGAPFRHLAVHFRSRVLTPATSAEIGLYFYGRRPARFGLVAPDRAHGYIGLGWKPLSAGDVDALLRRELGEAA